MSSNCNIQLIGTKIESQTEPFKLDSHERAEVVTLLLTKTK